MSPQQLDLFNQPTLNNLVREITDAMNQAIKDSGLSRDQVLDRMNDLAGRHGVRLNGGKSKELTKDTFEKWLNTEDESRVPSIKAMTIFCAVMGTKQPIMIMARLLGGMIIEGNDITMLQWAKRYHQARGLRKEMRELEADL